MMRVQEQECARVAKILLYFLQNAEDTVDDPTALRKKDDPPLDRKLAMCHRPICPVHTLWVKIECSVRFRSLEPADHILHDSNFNEPG